MISARAVRNTSWLAIMPRGRGGGRGYHSDHHGSGRGGWGGGGGGSEGGGGGYRGGGGSGRGRGGPPRGLRGKDIGLYYARKQKDRGKKDRSVLEGVMGEQPTCKSKSRKKGKPWFMRFPGLTDLHRKHKNKKSGPPL